MKRHVIYSFAGILLASMFFCVVSSASAQVSVSDIQAAIKASRATWVAAENPISKLTPEQQKQLLGVKNAPKTNTHPPARVASTYSLPPSLDWRNNGGNYVTSVKNQGSCGSCWAFSAVAALESATLINQKTPNVDLNLSEQVLISCCTDICGPDGDCGGGWPERAADFLRDQGAPPQTCYPYVQSGMCANACPNWQASAYKATGWEYVVNYEQNEAPTVDAIKAGLQHGPLAVAMAVYSDFMAYSGGVYQYVSGNLDGYHAVLVVGYNDAGQYFIVKNSWGSYWGEQGYFRIAYSEVTGYSQFGYETIAYYVGNDPNPPTCSYALAEYVAGSGGTGTVQLTLPQGTYWGGAANAYWMTMNPTSGQGSATLTYTVAPNASAGARTGILNTTPEVWTSGKSWQGDYAIFQDAGPSGCTYTISPTKASFDLNGGTGTVTVTAPPHCPWAVESTAYYVTIASAKSGSGNGTVTYSVKGYQGTTPQAYVINVADQIFTVSQTGCTYSVSPSSTTIGLQGGTGTVSVTATPGCPWTASSLTDWLTITSGATGTGNGTITYSVPPNAGASCEGSRAGTMTIQGQWFSVKQPGQDCSPSLSVSPVCFTSNGGKGTMTVTPPASCCSWTATSSDPWLSVTSGSSGSGTGTVGFSVQPTTGITSRYGTLYVKTQYSSQSTSVSEAGVGGCAYGLSPTNIQFTAAGGTGSVNVTTAGSGCSWYATSYSDWVTITSGSSGNGNGSVTFSVKTNTGSSFRGTNLWIGNGSQTVYLSVGQAAGSDACTYSITPTSKSFDAVGGTGTVTVTTASGCTWQATSNASWITVTGGASGSGNGSVGYSVTANTNTTSRSGTMTVAGQTFTVSQAGQSCTYTINPTSQSLSALSGSGSVNVTAGSGCSWTATSNASWITVTSGASGSGNGSVGYSVTANTSTSTRSGTLTIAGQTFSVSQSGGSTCTYSISSASNSFGAGSGSGTVNVSAPAGCAWTAVSNAPSWLSVTSGASGSGNGSVGYSAAANTTTTSRSGTLTIGGQTFTVTQAGMACTYSITPTAQTYTSAAGSGSVNVTAPSGCSWISGSNTTWLSITYGGAGSGNGTVSYSVTANTSTTSRNGTLTIAGQTFTVSQAAGGPTCIYALTPASQSYTAGGVPSYVNVTAPSGCTWTSASNTSWLSITSGGSGSGNGTVYFNVAANSGASRTGTMTIANQTFTATQAAQACTYSISPTSNSLGAAAGSGSVSVSAPSGCTWTATSNAGWITVSSGGSGSGNGSVGYSVTANSSTTSRTGTLTIGGQTFTVSQAGTAPVCSVSTTTGGFNVGYAGRQLQFTVQAASTCAWSASTNAPWITFISGAGKGNGTITFLVSTNTGAARTGTITIGTSTVTVNQAGATGTLSVAPASSLAFGTMKSGSTSVKPVTVSNVGQADLKITSITIDTLSGSVTSFSQSNPCGTVSPGGSCTISVKFAPGGQGMKSTYLYVYSDGGSAQLALTGSAQ